jgi:hypothetical protein
LLTLSFYYKILTGILPYGTARDGIIIFHVVTGDRPPHPTDTQWLPDQIWDMITACWDEKRERRWDIHAVYTQFSVMWIAPEDLKKLGVEPQLIPFIIVIILQVEQSPNGSPPLSPTETESLVEALDKVHPPTNFYLRTKSPNN